MSYNITAWKTKKLENLRIPIFEFYNKRKREDWNPKQPKILNPDTLEVEIECGCEQTITGFLKFGLLTITKIEMYGEGSGSFKRYVFDEVLKQSKGELEAILIWEGGDSITKLIVKDGVLTEDPIEL